MPHPENIIPPVKGEIRNPKMKTIEQINAIIELGNHSYYSLASYKATSTLRAYCTIHFESKKGGAGETYFIGKSTFELLK
jgi:hypothetical protein